MFYLREFCLNLLVILVFEESMFFIEKIMVYKKELVEDIINYNLKLKKILVIFIKKKVRLF